jgi:hypothetical protein
MNVALCELYSILLTVSIIFFLSYGLGLLACSNSELFLKL